MFNKKETLESGEIMSESIKIESNDSWVFYSNLERMKQLDINKVGKWMYFSKDKDFAAQICKNAVSDGVVSHAKHSNLDNDNKFVCCFYLNCDDTEAHKKCIDYLIRNELIQRTKTGKLFNIAFKLDTQTRNREYGSDFIAEIKLSDFVNLETGEWIK